MALLAEADDHHSPRAHSSNGTPTPTPTALLADAAGKKLRRNYQACMACRDRKVRCDLGNPDNPEPPCSRCKRESKHCYFSTTRRKNYKQPDAPPLLDDDDDAARPAKRAKTGNLPSTLPDATGQVPPRPRTPGGSESLVQPLRPRDGRGLAADVDDDDPAVIEDTAEVLQRSELHHGPDALGLLSTVALAAQNSSFRARTGSSGSLPRAVLTKDGAAAVAGLMPGNSPRQMLDTKGGVAVASPFSDGRSMTSDLKVTDEALQAWSRMRFVRAGLFTVQEGIDYLNYFYQYLNPLTPVTVPRYHDPSSHGKLLVEEPLLAVTMLTIASRYMSLKGPGAVSRSYRVHDALWSFLSGQIERLILGQEQFGGGFCGAGRKKQYPGLRTLGTVESLLLLTEWHARALHFPPGADSEELLIGDSTQAPASEEEVNEGKNGQIDSWLEPCWRSDRMVWSMLAIAQSLAAELNVFSTAPDPSLTFETHVQADEYMRRKENARRLLYIYISQTSGRLNLPSIMNRELCTNLFPHGPPLIGKTQPRRSASQPIPYYQIQETVLYFWYGIAQLFSDGNAKLFPSRDATRQIINSGRYSEMLAEYEASAKRWQDDFQQCSIIPIHMRNILIIEYEYALIYVNSIGLQAVINRCTDNAQSGVISPASLLEMLQGDRIYLEAIIKSSQKFLRAVVDGLLPEGYLKHSPVRTYLRIISVSMMLLKAFALGATGNDVSESLNLLDRATKALKDCVVDDVHIGSSVAELIGTLTQRARSRMIRIKAGTERKSQSAPKPAPAQTSRPMRPSASQTSQSSPPLNPYRPPNSASSSSAAWPGAVHQSPSFSTPNQITSPYYSNDQPPNMSIMPPSTWTPEAGFFGNSPYDAQGQPHYDSSFGMDFTQQGAEWCSLPLDNVLLGGQGGDVTQTGYGLDIGGRDMLNLLLMDDMQRNGNGNNNGSGNGHASGSGSGPAANGAR